MFAFSWSKPKKNTTQSGGVLFGNLIPILLLDLKGGSWQVSGGHLQPPWLFRRKASPTRGAKEKTANLTIGSLFAFFASKSIRIETDLLLPFCLAAEICVMAIGGNDDGVPTSLSFHNLVVADYYLAERD